MPPGSIVIRVQIGQDDIVGLQLKAEIFAGENKVIIAGDLAQRGKE